MIGYINMVMEILKENNIDYFYERSHNLIKTLCSDKFGEIFCMIDFEDNCITNYSLFSWRVPLIKLDFARRILDDVNRELFVGRFYYDEITSCIVYTARCLIPTSGHNRRLIERYCVSALEAGPRYQQRIYNAIYGDMAGLGL